MPLSCVYARVYHRLASSRSLEYSSRTLWKAHVASKSFADRNTVANTVVGLNHIKAHPSTGNRKPGLLLQIVPYRKFLTPSNSIGFQRLITACVPLPLLPPLILFASDFLHLRRRHSLNVPLSFLIKCPIHWLQAYRNMPNYTNMELFLFFFFFCRFLNQDR